LFFFSITWGLNKAQSSRADHSTINDSGADTPLPWRKPVVHYKMIDFADQIRDEDGGADERHRPFRGHQAALSDSVGG